MTIKSNASIERFYSIAIFDLSKQANEYDKSARAVPDHPELQALFQKAANLRRQSIEFFKEELKKYAQNNKNPEERIDA